MGKNPTLFFGLSYSTQNDTLFAETDGLRLNAVQEILFFEKIGFLMSSQSHYVSLLFFFRASVISLRLYKYIYRQY